MSRSTLDLTLHDFVYTHRRDGGSNLRDLSHSSRVCAAMQVLARLCPNMPAIDAWDKAHSLAEEFSEEND